MTTSTELPDLAESLTSVLARAHGENVHLVYMLGSALVVRINPAHMLDPRRKVDYVRVLEDDNTLTVQHLTHNGLIRGEAALAGSLAFMAVDVIAAYFELQ